MRTKGVHSQRLAQHQGSSLYNGDCVLLLYRCAAMQYLVLGWAVDQGDLEVIIKVVSQLCCSARADGGPSVIVVLTQREKLEMEGVFRCGQALPREVVLPAEHNSSHHLCPCPTSLTVVVSRLLFAGLVHCQARHS